MCTFKVHKILNDAIIYVVIHGDAFVHDNGNGGKYVKVDYHDGLVSSELWLKVQIRSREMFLFSKTAQIPC